MSELFNTLLLRPLYNLMVFIVEHVPYADIGVSVIILTIIVRLILFPLSKNALSTQVKMKKIQGPLKDLQEKHKDDKQKLALETMELYRKNNIKPFSGFFLLLLQLPVIIALYKVFISGGLPNINTSLLYSFISAPEYVGTKFLNLFDITQKNVFISLLVTYSSYFQAKISFKSQAEGPQQEGFGADLMKSMQIQMTYVFPIIMGFVAYGLGGIIGLYFLTGNIFTIFQQMYLKKKMDEHTEKEKIVEVVR